MFKRIVVFWFVLFATATVPSSFADLGMSGNPAAPSYLYVLFRIAMLNSIVAALLAIAYYLGVRVSGRKPPIRSCILAGAVVFLFLRVLSGALLRWDVAPVTVNFATAGSGCVVSFLIPVISAFGRAAALRERGAQRRAADTTEGG